MVALGVFDQGPFPVLGGEATVAVGDEARISCGKVGLETGPVETDIRADAGIVRDAEVVAKKELVDGFHEKRQAYRAEKAGGPVGKKALPYPALSLGGSFAGHGALKVFVSDNSGENDRAYDGEFDMGGDPVHQHDHVAQHLHESSPDYDAENSASKS